MKKILLILLTAVYPLPVESQTPALKKVGFKNSITKEIQMKLSRALDSSISKLQR